MNTEGRSSSNIQNKSKKNRNNWKSKNKNVPVFQSKPTEQIPKYSDRKYTTPRRQNKPKPSQTSTTSVISAII